ncbi:hypothetical protein ACI6Q2_22395 [Chitinophagaceae bacterium LWZ2-11]
MKRQLFLLAFIAVSGISINAMAQKPASKAKSKADTIAPVKKGGAKPSTPAPEKKSPGAKATPKKA